MQTDRRRINVPPGGTASPVFITPEATHIQRPTRQRKPDEHRKIFLRTGVVPSASGSAYYEIPPTPSSNSSHLIVPYQSSLKITCTVHGPRPLPRNAAFSPNLLLTTHVKFAPFATRSRRGYVRDASERDLGVHLENALRGIIIGERWPKSGVEVVVTILEGEEDGFWAEGAGQGKSGGGWGLMSALAGCVTAASAALADAEIDCVDLVTGGVAALVREDGSSGSMLMVDPAPSEHSLTAGCVVAYSQSRDEVTEVWMKGDLGQGGEEIMDGAVNAAKLVRSVLVEAVKESVSLKRLKAKGSEGKDAAMTG